MKGLKGLKFLIADDHKIVRNGIRYTIIDNNKSNYISKFDEAENGADAVQLAGVNNYDLIFMDIDMPEMDGITATRTIVLADPDAKIIAISMHDEEYQIRQMIEAGAKGYLLKNTGAEILNAAIATVLKGEYYISNEAAMKLLRLDNSASQKVENEIAKTSATLSDRERQILIMISNGQTNDEIAKELTLSKRTVDTHRQNILNKLNIRNTAGLIKYAINNKLID